MKYYEIEIPYPTNSGEYSYKKIFTSEKEMDEYFNRYLKENNLDIKDFVDTKNEWTGYGPNWETLHVWQTDDDPDLVIIMMVINNDKFVRKVEEPFGEIAVYVDKWSKNRPDLPKVSDKIIIEYTKEELDQHDDLSDLAHDILESMFDCSCYDWTVL